MIIPLVTALRLVVALGFTSSGFHTGFFWWGGGGRSSWGTATASCMSMHHTRFSVNTIKLWGLGACCPRRFFLDLRCNLRPGSNYFEKSSNSVLDIILTDSS